MEPTITLDVVVDFIREKKSEAKDPKARAIYDELIQELNDNRIHHKMLQNYEGFGGLIYDIRTNAEKTRREFGEAIGVGAGLIAQWELNHQFPSSKRIARISKAFGIDEEYLNEEKYRYERIKENNL